MTGQSQTARRFECRVFGPLEVRVDGVRAELGGPKQRQLLAVLLCGANSVVPVPVLIDRLWGETPPRTVRKNLQVCVSKLRKIVGDRLTRCGPGYRLLLDTDECDLLRFGRLVAVGRQALLAGSVGVAGKLLGEGVALWSAPPFADFPEESVELDPWWERYLAAVEDWAELRLDGGEWFEVIDRLGTLVRVHPLREWLAAAWMRALAMGGRASEAVAHYDVVRRALSAELGLAPSDSLRGLYQRSAVRSRAGQRRSWPHRAGRAARGAAGSADRRRVRLPPDLVRRAPQRATHRGQRAGGAHRARGGQHPATAGRLRWGDAAQPRPLVVAEQFAVLRALHGDRIDLGVGRASGGTTFVKAEERALRRDSRARHDFPELVDELLGFQHHSWPDGHLYRDLEVSPRVSSPPVVYVLGTSENGARTAAERSLPFVYGYHLGLSKGRSEAVRRYRAEFSPGPRGARAYVIASVNVLCAETDDEAERLAHEVAVDEINRRHGEQPEVRVRNLASRTLDEAQLNYGDPDTVRAGIEQVAEQLGADELMLVPYDLMGAGRSRTLRLAAQRTVSAVQ